MTTLGPDHIYSMFFIYAFVSSLSPFDLGSTQTGLQGTVSHDTYFYVLHERALSILGNQFRVTYWESPCLIVSA